MVDNISSLVQLAPNKPLPEPVMIHDIDAFMHHINPSMDK